MTEVELAQIEYRWTEGYNDCADLKEVFAEVRRLGQALDRYGRHEEGCVNGKFEHTQEDCDCGLFEALGLPGPPILPPYEA